MVQKIHPRGVIWEPYFPPPVEFFSKKSAECSVHLYSSPWVTVAHRLLNILFLPIYFPMYLPLSLLLQNIASELYPYL